MRTRLTDIAQRRARTTRRTHQQAHQPAQAPEPAPKRSRKAGGRASDTAHYFCSCGYVFDAQVSTSVQCPHCGAGQAW